MSVPVRVGGHRTHGLPGGVIVSYGDAACGRVAFCVSCRGSEFPARAFGVGVLLCCAAGTRTITSVCHMEWEAFIDWKA